MPGITPESPKRDHCDFKFQIPQKGKKRVERVIPASSAAPTNPKNKMNNSLDKDAAMVCRYRC
jgi:hypothetical protein